ncbi:MAG: biopolymer transporter ExbD [Alloprevotella sp.]|nr:biopolymer transporter ExbD [Alloprevotella sp.]MBR1445533.1 biopolymer transporter ExbD [Alloprevotella sp.]
MAKEKASRQKKMNARVDFTPMVDMIMLLVTFFMLCTTLQKPQTMEIAMPTDKEDIKDEDRSQIAASKAITILIGENRQVYYFKGQASDDNLEKTTFGSKGIRAVLMDANAEAQQKVKALKDKYAKIKSSSPQQDEINRANYKKELEEIRDGEDTPSIIIKPSEKASYKDLIDILDEMNICSIGRYVIVGFTPEDQAKIDRLNGGGGSAQ